MLHFTQIMILFLPSSVHAFLYRQLALYMYYCTIHIAHALVDYINTFHAIIDNFS